MKLHLPKLLRNSVLACITAVAGIATTTVGTATFTGGVVAFALAAAPQALADYTWIGGTGTATPKTQADWDTASNWNLGGESFNDRGKGPGTPNSNLWELIKINGGTEGVQIGSEDARIGLEGWKPRLHLDSKASLYANINKFQDTSTFTVINDSMLNLTHTGGQFRAATFNVGADSSIVLNLTTSFSNEMQTINLNAPDATMTIAHTGDLGTLTGPVTVNASLADIDEGTLGVQNVGLILDNVAISGALTFNFGSEWTLSETEITEANKAENEGKYYVYAEAGVYKVVYSQRSGPAWHGGALSWGADTVFSNGYSYTAGGDVAFSKADAAVTVVADVSAGRVKVKDGIKVSIGGEHTLTAETVSIGANAQLSILNGSAVALGSVSMKDGGQLNIATGGETTVQDVLGSATWTGGAIGVTNGTTVSLSDATLNTSNIVVDGSGSVLKVSNAGNATGKVYLEGDVTLKNGAVMEFVEGAGNDGLNYSNANRIEILSNSELRTNNNRLSLQGVDEIILNNGKVKGTGDDHGVLDFIEDGAVVVSSGTSSIEGSIRLRTSGATTTFQVDSGTLTISDFKNSQGNLAKTGAGTMIITGATNYPGTTTVNGGELILQATGNTGKGAITLGAGGTLTIAESANQAIGTTISGAGTLNLNGTLTINLASYTTLAASGGAYSDGENGYAEGLLVATVGTVNKGANGSVVVIDGETTNTYTSADINVSGGNMFVGSSDGTYFINTDVTYDAAKLGEVTGFCLTPGAAFRTADASVLSKTTSIDSTGTIYLSSPGSVIETAASASTYKGNVVITSGTEVKVMHKQALGVEYSNNATQTVTVEDGAVLDVNGKGDVYYSVVLEQGATLANKGGNVGVGNKQNPRVSLNGDATIDAQGEFGIVGSGYGTSYLTLNGHTLTKTGGSIFNLWNTSLNAGTIDIQEGTIRLGVNLAGSDSVDLKMKEGSVLNFADKGSNATLSKSWNSLTTYGSASAGAVQLNQIEGVALTITNGTQAATKINKTGAGSLTLSGTNTLGGGLTVSAGTLTLNGATTLGGTITIESGATLALGENVTVTLSSLAGFAGSLAAVPTTNGLVTGSTYKIVDNKNADNANNGLTSVLYNGETCTLGADGTISAGAKIYYAVEAGDGKVVTVGGSSPTADTANATEFYVGENGTLKIAGNASDSLTADQVLATTTGDGTIVLASTVGVATGTSIQFAGKLSIATGGALNFNPGKGAAADMSNVTAVEFDGGTVNYNAAPDVWNSVSVTTNGGTMNIQDHPDSNTTPIQFTGVTSLAGDLTINTSWKSYLYIEQVTGAGDLILSSTGGNTDGLGANTTVGVTNGFTGNIDIRGKAANKEHVTVDVGSGCTLAASRIIINDAAGVDVKLSGSGTYTNGDSLALAGGISLADGWKGTVAVTGANVTSTVDASALANSSSTLAISGLTVADGAALTLGGKVSLGGTVSVAESILANGTLTFGSDLKLSVAEDMIVAGSEEGQQVITLITGAGASAVGSMTTAMLSDELLALGVEDSWVFNSDGTISFTNLKSVLKWNPDADSIWKDTGAVGDETFNNADVPNVSFGAVAGTETVTVEGTVTANEVTINPGADGEYKFIAADGEGNQITAGEFHLASGTLVLGSGVIGSEVDLAMGGNTTLKWDEGNTTDYSGQLTIRGNATLDAGNNSVTLSNDISGLTADSTTTLKGNFTLDNDTVLKGSVEMDGGNLTLEGTNAADADNYNQNFSGSGSLSTTEKHGIHLKGTNTYTGATVLEAGSVLHIDTDSAYSAASKMTGSGELKLNAAGEYAWNMASDMTGTVTIASGATVKVTDALTTKFAGAGGLTVAGGTAETPITWDNTGKTYTGQTQLAAGAYVTTAGSLTTGANSKIVLGDNSQLTITDGLDSWTSGHTVSGTGTLVLSTGVTHTDAANKLLASQAALSNLVLRGSGTALEFGSSNDQVAPFNAASTVTIEDGASLIMNANFSTATNTVTLNGDGTGADGSAALCFSTHPWTDGNEHTTQLRSNVVLGSDSEVYVGTHTNSANNQSVVDKGVILGTITGNGNTLIKTGDGTLQINSIPVTAKIVVEAGTLDANAAGTWAENITMKNGASMLLSGETITLSDVTVDAAATTTIITGQANDADSTATLAKVSGSGVIELTRDNDGSRTGDYRVGLTGENADFTGTWKVTGRNVVLQAKHADALAGDTVELSYAGTRTDVVEMPELRLATTGDTVNLGKLTGAKGAVTGSGKVLNIANSETTGVEYSGAIGDGVTIQVSEGYQKITGADKTGTYTLSTIRTSVPEDDGLGGGALLLSEGTESVAPVLDLTGYAHSAADDAGVTTILAGNQGSIKGLVLGKNMLLTTMIGEEAATQTHIGRINDNLTLAGGKVLFHLTGSSAEGDYAYTGDVKAQYDLGGSNLVLTADTKTMLTFAPESLAGKLERRTYQLITNISSIEGIDDWTAVEGDENVFISEKVENLFGTNFSVEGRTVYRIVREKWTGGTYALSLEVSGGAATLEWNGVSGTWKTKGDEADTPWDNTAEGDDNLFWDDDHVVFNSTESSVDVTISDEDGVRIGSMSIVGAANYTFTGDAITSGEGMGQVNIGTTEEGGEYTGTVTFEKANSWKGSTNINSGAVVAKNAAALSDTTVNLKGGSLTVDGVALDAAVDMLGGALVGNGTASATVDLSDATAAKSVSAAADSTLTVTVAEGGMAGNITINNAVKATGTVKIATGEGKVTSTGAITVAGGTLDITGTLESSSTIAVNAGELDITGTVKAADVSTGKDAVVELGASTLEITGNTLSGSIESAGGTLKSSAENGTTLSKLTIGGENTDTTLSGSWTIGKSSVTWDKDATGKLVLAESSTLKLKEDTTLQRVQASADGSNIVKAADAKDLTLSVGFINLNTTIGEGITLKVTGQSDTQDDATWISEEAKAGAVVIDVAESYTKVSGNAAYLATSTTDSVEIKRGRVLLHSGDITVNKGITLNGDGAILATQLTDIATAAETPADITLINGKLEGFGNYAGTIDINDGGIWRDYDLGGLTDNASVHLGLLSVIGAADKLNETAGYSSLTNLGSLKLAGTNIVTLSEAMTAEDAKAIFNTTGAISLADGADLTFGVNSLAAKMNNGDTVKLHVGGDLTALAGKALFDASLSLMNITATLGADGYLTLTKIKPTSDNIFVSTDEGDTEGEVLEEVVISGENAYTATEGYTGIVVDHNTTIDLTESSRNENQTDGMVLSNLMGTATSSEDGSSTTLTIAGSNATAQEGKQNDLVTINPNLDHAEMEETAGGVMEEAGVKDALSFDGDIKVSGADLQYKATDSQTGELAETTYNVNGNLTADEHSQVIVTSGVLALNGTENKLEGGITVDQTNGTLELNGENTTIGGTVAAAKDAEGNVTNGEGISIAAGATATLADNAVLTDGVSIVGDSASSIVVAGTTTIKEGASISGSTLSVGEGKKLTVVGEGTTLDVSTITLASGSAMKLEDGSATVKAEGLAGSGALESTGEATVQLTVTDETTYSGDLSNYTGSLCVQGEGVQVLSGDASGKSVDLHIGEKPASMYRMLRMTRVAPAAEDAAVASHVDLDMREKSLEYRDIYLHNENSILCVFADRANGENNKLTAKNLNLHSGTLNLHLNLNAVDGQNSIIDVTQQINLDGAEVHVNVAGISDEVAAALFDGTLSSITLATADSVLGNTAGNITADGIITKYFGNSASVNVVDDKKLVLSGTLVTAEDASWYQDNAESANGTEGAKMLDYAFGSGEQQKDTDLADVLDTVETLITSGNITAADEAMAAVAGASTAVLGMAVSGDVDRQLQAIRNRTTTMGVDQSVANEDMPYFNAWINAEGDRRELSESGTEAGYELNSWGGTVGFDVDFTPTFTAGMALTAMYGDLDVTGADKATGDLDTQYLSVFARYAPSAWTHTFVGTVGKGDISLNRTVVGVDVEGETESLSFGFMYEVGRVFALDEDGSACLQPVFNVTWKHTTVDGYTEKGSDLALEVDEQTLDTVTFGLGARLQTVVGESIYNRTSILEARVLAKADVGDRSGSTDVALSALPGVKASVDSAEMGAFGLEAGAGLTIPVGDDGGSIFMDASVELRSDYTNVNGTVGYRINF